MGSVSGEVGGVEEVDILENSYMGCTKTSISLELLVRLTSNLGMV